MVDDYVLSAEQRSRLHHYLKYSYSQYLPREALKIGEPYVCRARNFSVGVWNGVGFDYLRQKMGVTFPSVEYHYDDGVPFGTVRPYFRFFE